MFESLTQRLSHAVQRMSGRGRITEENIRDVAREIRRAPLGGFRWESGAAARAGPGGEGWGAVRAFTSLGKTVECALRVRSTWGGRTRHLD